MMIRDSGLLFWPPCILKARYKGTSSFHISHNSNVGLSPFCDLPVR